jgi:hypothetical protein
VRDSRIQKRAVQPSHGPQERVYDEHEAQRIDRTSPAIKDCRIASGGFEMELCVIKRRRRSEVKFDTC